MKKKRNLMAELTEGFVALADQRTGKRTLRTHVVQTKATPKMTAKELSALRERMNLSRALFAKYLRTNVRTLENWEQGRARPNAQAALLIRTNLTILQRKSACPYARNRTSHFRTVWHKPWIHRSKDMLNTC